MLGIPDVWVCVCYEGYLVVVLFAVSKENQPWQAAVVFSLVLFEGTHAHTHPSPANVSRSPMQHRNLLPRSVFAFPSGGEKTPEKAEAETRAILP